MAILCSWHLPSVSVLLLVCGSTIEAAFCDTSGAESGSRTCLPDDPVKDQILMQLAHVKRKGEPSADCGEACIEACRGSKTGHNCEAECKECPELMQVKSFKRKLSSADCGDACIEGCQGNWVCEGECKECPELSSGESSTTTTSWLWSEDNESHSTTMWSSTTKIVGDFGDANGSSSGSGWFSGTTSSSTSSSTSGSTSTGAWIGGDWNWSDLDWSASGGNTTTTTEEPSGNASLPFFDWWKQWFR